MIFVCLNPSVFAAWGCYLTIIPLFPKVRRELESPQYNKLLRNNLTIVAAPSQYFADWFHELGQHFYLSGTKLIMTLFCSKYKNPFLLDFILFYIKSFEQTGNIFSATRKFLPKLLEPLFPAISIC